MINSQRIFLVGPMGAGKTTVGKHLARLLGMGFFDLDSEIEARSGADISWIFDVEGEPGFRDRETAMLKELAAREAAIIATGGGIVLRAENREILVETGTVVYLAVPVATLIERTRSDTRRPLLQVEDREAAVEKLASERAPLYEEVASITYTGDKASPHAAAQSILKLVQQQQS